MHQQIDTYKQMLIQHVMLNKNISITIKTQKCKTYWSNLYVV